MPLQTSFRAERFSHFSQRTSEPECPDVFEVCSCLWTIWAEVQISPLYKAKYHLELNAFFAYDLLGNFCCWSHICTRCMTKSFLGQTLLIIWIKEKVWAFYKIFMAKHYVRNKGKGKRTKPRIIISPKLSLKLRLPLFRKKSDSHNLIERQMNNMIRWSLH